MHGRIVATPHVRCILLKHQSLKKGGHFGLEMRKIGMSSSVRQVVAISDINCSSPWNQSHTHRCIVAADMHGKAYHVNFPSLKHQSLKKGSHSDMVMHG